MNTSWAGLKVKCPRGGVPSAARAHPEHPPGIAGCGVQHLMPTWASEGGSQDPGPEIRCPQRQRCQTPWSTRGCGAGEEAGPQCLPSSRTSCHTRWHRRCRDGPPPHREPPHDSLQGPRLHAEARRGPLRWVRKGDRASVGPGAPGNAPPCHALTAGCCDSFSL